MMDLILFRNSLLTIHRLTGNSNNCFKIILGVFASWHCVNAHLNVPDWQTAKTPTLEMLTLTDRKQ